MSVARAPRAPAASRAGSAAAGPVLPGGEPVPPAAPVVPGSLGILGGTFDPIHFGHLAIAEEARESLGLERVLLVPAAAPPHKPGRPVTPAADRLAMAELAAAGNPAFHVSRIELDRGGASYTVDTLEALTAEATAAGRVPDLWFILSSEALAEFASWRRPARILELARLAVVPRGGYPALDAAWLGERFPGAEARAAFLPGPLLAVSGSVIRRRAAAGRSLRYLVPDAVARYIADHGLYATAAIAPPAGPASPGSLADPAPRRTTAP